MSVRWVLGCALVVVSLSGCPGPECSVGEPCANGLLCSAAGRCEAPDAGGGGGGGACADNSIPSAPNLLQNPGAECGTASWFVPDVVGKAKVEADASGGHSGTQAFKLTATGNGDAYVWSETRVSAGANETWCAQAFMKGGTASDGRLGVRHWPTSDSSAFIDDAYSSPVSQDWVVVPPTKGLLKFTTGASPETLQLRVVMQAAVSGETLLFDDVQLWKSAAGTCTER